MFHSFTVCVSWIHALSQKFVSSLITLCFLHSRGFGLILIFDLVEGGGGSICYFCCDRYWFIDFQFNPTSVLEVLFGLIFGFSIFLFFGLCRRVYIFFSFTFTLVQQISWFDSFIFAIASVFWFWQESWKLWRDHCVQKVWIPYYSRPLSSCMTSHLFYLFSEPYFDNIFWQHHPNEIRDKHKKVFILYV